MTKSWFRSIEIARRVGKTRCTHRAAAFGGHAEPVIGSAGAAPNCETGMGGEAHQDW